ncbi:MAG: 6-hydroxymethylpterin diphosphokinase MptE-like protein, partial [Phycisphaerae bacterium]
PAILVAAGPSLAKNVHLLKEIREGKRRAVIIAVQTMLKPLLAMGIEPDFVTSLDYNPISTQFFENLGQAGSAGRVHLVAEAKANWHVLDVFTRHGGPAGETPALRPPRNAGVPPAVDSTVTPLIPNEHPEIIPPSFHREGTMSLAANEFADKLLRDAEAGLAQGRMGVKAGATVAHLSFYLAEFLGCDPIILVGQDLGFVNGLYYKPGTAIHETWAAELGRFNTLETKEWERISRSKALLRKIPDIHGQPMYTEEQFFVYLQQFERDFAASRCRVIDATEGGARKQHVTLMTLRAALDQFCQMASEAGAAELEGGKTSDRWKHWGCDRPVRLQAALEALARRRAECAALKETCLATVPLLDEMIASQENEARMGELFVAVDRLRSKVGQDQVIFEIVCNLNTIGELRRFQHDLSVKAAEKDSLERQKRQLLRDIDYVKNLNIGCDRLLEILAEAIKRLERQLETVRQGAPWPVEMAGGSGARTATKGNQPA